MNEKKPNTYACAQDARAIVIGYARGSLTAKPPNWKNSEATWGQIQDALTTPTKGWWNRDPLTEVDYAKLSEAEQKRRKSGQMGVNAFFGGQLAFPDGATSGSKNKANVRSRSVLTIDADGEDGMEPEDAQKVVQCIRDIGLSAAIYSTYSARDEAPRYRIVIPLDHPVDRRQYEWGAHRFCIEVFGEELTNRCIDKCSWGAVQAMIVPSYLSGIKPFTLKLNGDALDLSQYAPPVDVTENNSAAKTQTTTDARKKKGVVGAFNSAYTIHAAIDQYLSDKFIRVTDDRYRYAASDSAPGFVVYPSSDGVPAQYAYSHHMNEDPYAGRLMDAFTLVRLHLYGNMDMGKETVPLPKRPSFATMMKLADTDPAVNWTRSRGTITMPESRITQESDSEQGAWMKQLAVDDRTGRALAYEAVNIKLILEHDEYLKDAFALNIMNNEVSLMHPLPGSPPLTTGRRSAYPVPLDDTDVMTVMTYLSNAYTRGKLTKAALYDYIALSAARFPYHPVAEYLRALPPWDGIPRINTLFIDRLYAEDTALTREASQLFLVGAVMRALQPGSKFDNVLILQGPQGIGKSSILRDLGGDFYVETYNDVCDTETLRILEGNWICELSELASLNPKSAERIKSFCSRAVDSIRPLYGRLPDKIARTFVCAGTTNSSAYLSDNSGNRRFWIIKCGAGPTYNLNPLTPDERDQVWAEALHIYTNRLYDTHYMLSPRAENQLAETHNATILDQTLELEIIDYINELVPVGWEKWTMDQWVAFGQDRPLEQQWDNAMERNPSAQDVSKIVQPWGTYANDYTDYRYLAPIGADIALYPKTRVDVQEIVKVLRHDRVRGIDHKVRDIMDHLCEKPDAQWKKNEKRQKHGRTGNSSRIRIVYERVNPPKVNPRIVTKEMVAEFTVDEERIDMETGEILTSVLS